MVFAKATLPLWLEMQEYVLTERPANMTLLCRKPRNSNMEVAGTNAQGSSQLAGDGLSQEVAAGRLEKYGLNEPAKARKNNWLLSFIERFKNPLVIILMGAGLVSAATGEMTGFTIIFAIVCMSITMDFVQQYRADKAVERLSQSVSLENTVLRDQKEIRIPSRQIVPGDLVLLSAGDLIPADGVLIKARDFFVNQSMLTGETYPVEKKHTSSAEMRKQKLDQNDLNEPHFAFAGSSVVSGIGRLLILSTGANTVLGSISTSLAARRPETSFESGVRKFGMMIMRVTLVLVVFAFAVNIAAHRPLLQSLLFGVALAVGLTPELLPMVITVTLSKGALEMARQSVIVKRLSAVQDLGSMSVLCTDKTGTLTEGKIVLEKHVDFSGADSQDVLQLAYLNSYFETGVKSALDDAILAHQEVDMSGWKKIDEVPFDFERRRVSVLAERGSTRLLSVKGAADSILKLCNRVELSDARVIEVSAEVQAQIDALFKKLAEDGFHILAIAYKNVEHTHDHARLDDEKELVFKGFAAFLDPPKSSAKDALIALGEDNVQVKVLSGDHELVAKYVCKKLDFEISGLLIGDEINKLDDHALQARCQNTNLFCRVTPSQKTRIIAALKARGATVGFLGDGINDAPSLHTADVGISVDTAVDVAKQAADMVLLKHDLKVLHAGIREGRRAFVNVQKYILMATSSNFGNMFSMAVATIFLPFLPMLPVQILLNNLLYDLSELALPLDNVDEELLSKPSHGDINFIKKFMVSIGPISSIFDFITFFVLIAILKANESLFHTGWFVESLATQILVIFVIRTRRSCLKSKPGKLLVLLSLSIVLAACILTLPPFAQTFGFSPLPPVFFGILALIAGVYLGCVEIAKHVFYKRLKSSTIAV